MTIELTEEVLAKMIEAERLGKQVPGLIDAAIEQTKKHAPKNAHDFRAVNWSWNEDYTTLNVQVRYAVPSRWLKLKHMYRVLCNLE